MNNEYLKEFNDMGVAKTFFSFIERDKLVNKYAWAVPNEKAIQVLATNSPVVEIAAGTGYWAKLISEAGGEIVAFDEQPRGPNVRVGSYEVLSNYSDHTLFLCWPPYCGPLAFDCVTNYHGKKVVYVGEGHGGCTGDDQFHEYLDEKFNLERSVSIPQWWGIHDNLTVWSRK